MSFLPFPCYQQQPQAFTQYCYGQQPVDQVRYYYNPYFPQDYTNYGYYDDTEQCHFYFDLPPEDLFAVKLDGNKEPFGVGASAVVYEGTCVEDCYTKMAVKLIPKLPFLNPCTDHIKQAEAVAREVFLMSLVSSPYVISLRKLSMTKDYFVICSELIDGNTLYDHFSEQWENADQVRSLVYMLLKGLADIHSKGIIHRDINLQNIYIRSDGRPAIGDFGSGIVKDGRVNKDASGTRQFWPPELATRGWTEKADVWAMGRTLFYFLTKQKPEDVDVLQIPFLPDDLTSIICDCLISDHNVRPTAQELLERSIFENINIKGHFVTDAKPSYSVQAIEEDLRNFEGKLDELARLDDIEKLRTESTQAFLNALEKLGISHLIKQ